MQKQTERQNTVSTSGDEWQDTVSFVRHQTEDKTANGIIQHVELEENTAYITVQPVGLDQNITCTLNATVKPRKKSQFERFLEDQGYEPTEDDLLEELQGEKCELSVSHTNNNLTFNIHTPDPDQKSKRQKQIDKIKTNGMSLAFGYLIGAIPLVNLLYIYNENIQAFKPQIRRKNTFDRKDFYLAIGVATSSLIIYGMILPVIFFG